MANVKMDCPSITGGAAPKGVQNSITLKKKYKVTVSTYWYNLIECKFFSDKERAKSCYATYLALYPDCNVDISVERVRI